MCWLHWFCRGSFKGKSQRRVGYVQDKVREGETGNPSRSQPGLPGTGREGALGYERYIAGEHMDKVRPRSGREGALGYVRRDYVQDERYIAGEHMDVRRDCVSLALRLRRSGACQSRTACELT